MVYQIEAMKRYPATLAMTALAVAPALCGALGAGCAPGGPARPPPDSPSGDGTSDATPTGTTAAAAGGTALVVPRPNKKLTLAEARRYMLALVNRDRGTMGLPPVELDEGPPTVAGQAHSEDMAKLGYLGHWGSDGSVPEQRHTEAGGADMVLENALCFTDEAKRSLDPKPLIDPAQIERAESLFFEEVPPNDGHRKNILKPGHTRVGIGIAQPVATATEIPTPCVTQEFIDTYGTYSAIPKRAKIGATVKVEATLAAGVRPSGVGVARIVRPGPIAPSELNKRRSYPVPKPFQMYWGPGFGTPIPVKIEGQKLSIEVPLSDRNLVGLYEVSVWAKLPGSEEHAMVGLRTVLVE